MNRFSTLFLLVILLGNISNAQEIRGLYVNRVDSILGNPEAEQELLSYLSYGQFNSVSFYSLYRLDFSDAEVRHKFRSLIRKAREDYGVTRFGAVSENLEGFTGNIHLYNQDTLTESLDRLDHYNVEFEFWSERATSDYYCTKYLQPGGYPCNPAGALEFVTKMVRDLREEIKAFPGIEIEMYVGWLTPEEALTMATLVDRLLIAVYREMEEDGSVELYNFAAQRKRLEYLGAGGEVSVVPIFSSFDGSSDDNLSGWLDAGHTICEAWDLYLAGFEQDRELPNRQNIKLEGYQWFKYSSMPVIPQNLNTPGPIFGPGDPAVNQQAKYLIPLNPKADQYEWSVFAGEKMTRIITKHPVLRTVFDQPGIHVLQVRALGCGEISNAVRKTIKVHEQKIDRDTLIGDRDDNQDFGINIEPGGLHLTIAPGKRGPFHVEAVNVRGKTFLSKTLENPGEYFLKFSPPPDSASIINISVIYPGGAFSKKFSILEQQEH